MKAEAGYQPSVASHEIIRWTTGLAFVELLFAMKPTLRVAVIGMGPIGNRHADCYQSDALAQLVGVCDIVRERADAAAKRLGVPAFYDLPAMLPELQPDVCSICTGGYEYGSDHCQPTLQAL